MGGWRRKWCRVNIQFGKNREVMRWKAVDGRQRWSKSMVFVDGRKIHDTQIRFYNALFRFCFSGSYTSRLSK